LNSSFRNLGPAPSKRNFHKLFIKKQLKHASNDDDDEWVKDKPVLVGKVQLDNTGSKLRFYTFELLSARAEDLSSKGSVWKAQT